MRQVGLAGASTDELFARDRRRTHGRNREDHSEADDDERGDREPGRRDAREDACLPQSETGAEDEHEITD